MPQGEFEHSTIEEALNRANADKSHVARLLGLTRNAFLTACRRWG